MAVAAVDIGRVIMPWFRVPLSMGVVVLLGIAALAVQPVAVAQEATPASEEVMDFAGITFEPLSFAFGADVATPADLVVVRIGFDPGASLPGEENDPTVAIMLVESGTLTVQADGPLTVTRGAGMGEAMATAEATGDFSTLMEAVAAGEAVTLEAGDAAYLPANLTGDIRNDGQERAVAVAFLVVPPEGMMGEATPAP
jgi:quercetin dioxygenase-like cupin family protein